MEKLIIESAENINQAKNVLIFSGAGISTGSGIPTFRGDEGIWTKYNPEYFEYEYFLEHPDESWKLTKYVFYNRMLDSEPSTAHHAISQLQQMGKIQTIITQNIDNLHQRAGSKNVIDFHGNIERLVCIGCEKKYSAVDYYQYESAPHCPECGNFLKPDFIFFGEQIPNKIYLQSIREAQFADLLIIIGTSGEVMPANLIPYTAKKSGSLIIEINTHPSNYTDNITDIFLEGKADNILKELKDIVVNKPSKK